MDIEAIESAYPKRSGGQGWVAARRLIKAHISRGVVFEDMLEGTKSYSKWCDYTGKTGTELVKQARTFFGRDEWWGEDYEIPELSRKPRRPEQISEEQRQIDARKAVAQMNEYRSRQNG